MLELQNASKLQRSFREFTKLPENAVLVEQAHAQELTAVLDLQDAAEVEDIRRRLSYADVDTQRALGPFLQHRPVMRVVSTLFNDPTTDVSVWAANPVVLKLLRRARRLLQDKVMDEQQLEDALLAALKRPANPGCVSECEQHSSARRVAVTPEQLASAMNEQMEERQLGNQAYTTGDPQTALHHYNRGLAVLRLLQPSNPSDKQAIREAEAALLLNSAAAHLTCGAYGACVEACCAVLAYDPANVTALLRRAKAHMLRHEHQAAEEDLAAADQFSGGSCALELRTLRQELRTMRLRDRKTDRSVYSRMFKS